MAFQRHWEEFPVGPQGRNGGGGGLWVTLSRKGEIMVGAKAFEQLGRPEAAVLLYDRRNKVIGLAPAPGDAENGFPLHAKPNGRHRLIRANIFCRHHGIRVQRTTAFGNVEMDEDGVMLLDLKRMVNAARSEK
jgi:hypothetical protein